MRGRADVDAGWLPQIPANDEPFLVVHDSGEHDRNDGFDHEVDKCGDNGVHDDDGAKLRFIEHDVFIVTAKTRFFSVSPINSKRAAANRSRRRVSMARL